MKKQIVEQLDVLEKEKSIKILYAVESGSRAWGFESKDSDFDIRFIYIHPYDWYLSIDNKRDFIEFSKDKILDFSGWELRKALRLFRKSNPPLLEWLRSPTIYLEEFGLAQQMRKLSKGYFSPKSCIYHYLHMAVGNYREYLKRENVRVKKYFYVLRPILACQWIEKNNSIPPVEFRKLLLLQAKDRALKNTIEKLLKRKMEGDELGIGPKIPILNKFLEERIDYFKDYVKEAAFQKKLDPEQLNRLFKDILKRAWE